MLTPYDNPCWKFNFYTVNGYCFNFLFFYDLTLNPSPIGEGS